MRFNPNVVYGSGKNQATQYAPSWVPVDQAELSDDELANKVELFSVHSINILPETPNNLKQISETRMRASQSVWWPGIHDSIVEMVSRCNTCSKYRPHQGEPLLTASFPSHPWGKVGAEW